MTLCIAAACKERDEARIVTCIDWKATTQLGSSQTFDKFREIKAGWIALVAGGASRAKEMVAALKKEFNATEITQENLVPTVKKAMVEHAANLRDEYCGFRFGKSYDDFQKWCANVNPVLAKPYVDELTQIKFGASIVIAGFVKDDKDKPEPIICRINQAKSEVTSEEHFGAIGEGISVAVPPLLRREYDWREVQLGKAIYYLYEAKTLAEIIDSVGESTSIDVLYPDGGKKSLEEAGYDYFDGLLKKFGPKPKVTGVTMKASYLGSFDDVESHSITPLQKKKAQKKLAAQK